MTFDCTTPKYDELYAPWLENPGRLLDIAGWKPPDSLLDLAGGTGIVAREAVRRCQEWGGISHVALLDLNPRVPPSTDGTILHKWVSQTKGRAECVDDYYAEMMFDVVVCRQAIGYLNPVYVIPGVHKVLKIGGRFVFNSFAKPPAVGMRLRKADGAWFLETHVAALGRVAHVQARIGAKPGVDFSVFAHHDATTLYELLRPWFKVDLRNDGPSFRWVCTKESR